jgi:hypothetical protein
MTFLSRKFYSTAASRRLARSEPSTIAIRDSIMKSKSSFRNAIAWRAVFRKDRRHDGKFVYGAVTTGIYCRPSCPARNPKPGNIRMFGTADEAERQGYRACLRCHPNSLVPAERSVQAVLDCVETHLDKAGHRTKPQENNRLQGLVRKGRQTPIA